MLSREDYQQAIIDYIEYLNNKLIKVKQNKGQIGRAHV